MYHLAYSPNDQREVGDAYNPVVLDPRRHKAGHVHIEQESVTGVSCIDQHGS